MNFNTIDLSLIENDLDRSHLLVFSSSDKVLLNQSVIKRVKATSLKETTKNTQKENPDVIV
jgi:hypothetical protein